MKAPALNNEERQIKPGRAVLGTIGLRRVLAPGPVKITEPEFRRAVELEPKLHDIVGRFLDGKREAVPFPEYDHADVEAMLFRVLNDEDITQKLAQYRGHPAGEDFISAANQAALFLRTKMPRRMRSAFTGPTPVRPSTAELFTWRRYLETVGNPLWAVRNLLAATLGREHIEALAAVWPDVLAAVRAAAENGIADRLEQNPRFTLTRRQIRQLAVLLEKDPTAPRKLVAALQQTFAAEAKAAQNQETATPPDDKLKTPVQRVAER